MIIYGVWARIASYVSPKSCKFSPKCGKRRAVSLIFEIISLIRLISQGALKSGISTWVDADTNPTGGTAGGQYHAFTLKIDADSLGATAPVGTNGSLTTVANADGSDMTPYEEWQADDLFSNGKPYRLTEITMMGRYNNETSFKVGTHLTVTDSSGTSIISDVLTTTKVTWQDPWSPSFYYTSYETGVFTFGDGLDLVLGETYTFTFTDSSGTVLERALQPQLQVTENSDLGFVNDSTRWSPIMAASVYIPEPSTATLSLVALSGLLLRRRRKTA